jgi:hypothetical protein
MLGAIAGAAINAGFGFLGARRSEKHAQKMFNQNAALQRQFAQQGIQWKVADARAAGIHPLAALGASTHSAAPIALGADHSGISNAGQDISRAMQTAFKGRNRQMDLYQSKVRELNLKNMELRNGLLASQIARNTQAGQVPRTGIGGPMLVDGQPDSDIGVPPGVVITTPKRRVTPGARLSEEAGAVTDSQWIRTGKGWARVPSTDAKRAIEDMIVPSVQWQIRNQIGDMYGRNRHPPVKLKRGHYWRYQPITGNWFQSPRRRPWEYYRR